MTVVKREVCQTAGEFIDHLRPSRKHWVESRSNQYVYRGAWNCSEWKLLPSAWRDPPADLFAAVLKELDSSNDEAWEYHCRYRKNWHGLDATDENRTAILRHLMQFAAELDCVKRFADLADELGLHIPGKEDIEGAEEFLLGKVVESRPVRLVHGGPSPSMYPIHGLAQHHGVPTRLLDWTYNPLKAAYFAACLETRREESKELAVWSLHRKLASGHKTEHGLTVLVLQVPRHSNSFLHAQDGLFTWLDGADQYYMTRGRWPLLDEILADEVQSGKLPENVLRVCTLPISEADALLHLLWHERVSRAHLMPTFDNVKRGLEEYLGTTADDTNGT